jgi:hypothetical protein
MQTCKLKNTRVPTSLEGLSGIEFAYKTMNFLNLRKGNNPLDPKYRLLDGQFDCFNLLLVFKNARS